MKNHKLLCISASLFLFSNQILLAAYANSLETFDGTVIDTDTWTGYMLNPGPSHIEQNDNVML